MRISALLNHDLADTRQQTVVVDQDEATTVEHCTDHDYVPPPARLSSTFTKKARAKEAKDAAKFERGMTTGIVNYPPFEAHSEAVRCKLKKHHVYPESDIGAYPRHIPYRSDKKGFQLQTGRGSFEVFQYTFRCGGSTKDWTVMWDYNIGLVRITPFFKALAFAKTIPAKAIGKSPGLKELCHSITGGALAAQGYWMPFEAAKALAATFCWDIRYALTPIFGPGFVRACVAKGDDAFNVWTIDSAVVAACRQQVSDWTVSRMPPSAALVDGEQLTVTMAPRHADDDAPAPGLSLKRAHHSGEANGRWAGRGNIQSGSGWTAINACVSSSSSSNSSCSASASSPSSHSRAASFVSPTLSSSSRATRSATMLSKRSYSDESGDAAEADSAASSIVSKRRRLDGFDGDEARAAYSLLQLSMVK